MNTLPKFIGTLTTVRTGKIEPFVRGVSAINKIPIDGSMKVDLLGLDANKLSINFTVDHSKQCIKCQSPPMMSSIRRLV